MGRVQSKVLRATAVLALLFWLRAKLVRLVAWVRRERRTRKLLEALPGFATPKMHLLGNLLNMVPEDKPLTRDNIRDYMLSQMSKLLETPELKDHGVVRLWQLNERIPIHGKGAIYVVGGEEAREILATKNLDKWVKGRSYKISEPLIGHGVLSTSGPEWARQRPILENFFKSDILKMNLPRVLLTAKEFTSKIKAQSGTQKEGVIVDVHEELLKVTLDVLGRVAFSYDIGSTTAPTTAEAPLYHAFDTILSTLVMRIRNPFLQLGRNLPLQVNKDFDRSLGKLEDVVRTIIDERIARTAMEKNGQKVAAEDRSTDLLDILLAGLSEEEEMKYKSGGMSKEIMIDNIKTMLFAGHDTTAAAGTWFARLLAEHPDVADKIRAEAAEYLGDLESVPDLDKLETMPYLNSVVLEVLRLYPSAAFTRRSSQDVQVGRYLIPAHTEVLIFPYFVQRDPKEFERPNDFLPERWTKNKTGSENVSLQAQLAKETLSKPYLPFSLGKRNCVGRPLALVEIRLIILQILYEFNIRIPTAEQLQAHGGEEYQSWPAMGLTLNPKGVNLVFEPRQGGFTERG
mmetsp:Transcript_6963/g.12271  ORF Transcript_6963/g.12271 Transcript_6963/m.12271 type:complete len:571 (-) Transcript_6963:992-2704(-)